MTGQHTDQRDERGSLSILTLGLVLIATFLILGGVGVTAALVARMRVTDAADGAALSAANAFDPAAYEQGVGDAVPLSDARVRELAGSYLDSRPLPTDVTGWALERGTGSPDGQSAVVVLTARVELPIVGSMLEALGSEVSVTVTSRARAVIR
jgi:hypothetical protein